MPEVEALSRPTSNGRSNTYALSLLSLCSVNPKTEDAPANASNYVPGPMFEAETGEACSVSSELPNFRQLKPSAGSGGRCLGNSRGAPHLP